MRDLSLHLMDLAQNSLTAGATAIDIRFVKEQGQLLSMVVADNGCGMDGETLQKALSPFGTSRITRKIGLGIPLTREHCLMSGGRFDIKSAPGQGTVVEAGFDLNHLDCPPPGDIAQTLLLLITANPEAPEWRIRFTRDGDGHQLDTRQVKNALSGISLNAPEVITWLDDTLKDLVKGFFEGVEA